MSMHLLDFLVLLMIGIAVTIMVATLILLKLARKSLIALTQISIAERSNTVKLAAVRDEIEKIRRRR